MPETPKNQTLGTQTIKQPTDKPPAPPKGDEYPKVLYHKDSTPGNLISKQVANEEEASKLGGEYVPLSELDIKTAPSQEEADEQKLKAAKEKK